jgi:hypothetical protein
MRTILIVTAATVSFTAGAALSLQAIRSPASASLHVPKQASSPSAAEVALRDSSGLASAATIHQIHTVAIAAAPEVAPQAALPTKSAAVDYYDVQPTPTDHVAADRAEGPADKDVNETTPSTASPLTIASLAQQAVEAPDQPYIAPSQRHPRRAAVAKPTATHTIRTISPRRTTRRKARLTTQPATASVQSSADDEIHNPLTTISELLQRGL